MTAQLLEVCARFAGDQQELCRAYAAVVADDGAGAGGPGATLQAALRSWAVTAAIVGLVAAGLLIVWRNVAALGERLTRGAVEVEFGGQTLSLAEFGKAAETATVNLADDVLDLARIVDAAAILPPPRRLPPGLRRARRRVLSCGGRGGPAEAPGGAAAEDPVDRRRGGQVDAGDGRS